MNCREVEEQDIFESYVLGQLTDSERDAFEQHYFECDACFSQLQMGLALQEELRQHPPRHRSAGGASFRWWIWAPAFASVALILAAGGWWYTARIEQSARQVSPPAPAADSRAAITQPSSTASPQIVESAPPRSAALTLEEMARVEPPPYSEVVLRGAEDEAQESFHRAMQHYLKGDYVGAIPGLQAAVKASPATARFHFYLGACYLLTAQTDPAINSFRKVISLNDPSYSEAAHFYIAKAYLRNRDLTHAEDELRTTAKLGGSKAREAEELLRQPVK
jgi:TolA-binding protein